MPAARKFCTSCGVPVDPSLRFCTSCGTAIADNIPPVAAGIPVTRLSPGNQKAGIFRVPETLPELLVMVIRGMTDNIRRTATGMIKGLVLAAVIIIFINTLLQVTNLSESDIAHSVIAAAGLSSSPNALLFWFLFSAILAFFWSQIVNLGLRGTLKKAGTLPRWIQTSAAVTGITAFPLIMAGIAAALVVRLYLLNAINGIGILILMFGILFSQQESLAILAMSLGYSDVHRIVGKGPHRVPPPAFPVMGVLGALIGFILVLFIADSLTIIVIVIALMLIASALIWYRKKKTFPGTTPTTEIYPSGRKVP